MEDKNNVKTGNKYPVPPFESQPQRLPYAATKAAIQNLTANLAQTFQEDGSGIRVNGVAPGPVWTALIPSTIPNHDEFGMNSPMGRPAQPAELAPVFVFLASDEASYVSGAVIPVTGGQITL